MMTVPISMFITTNTPSPTHAMTADGLTYCPVRTFVATVGAALPVLPATT